MHIRSQILNFMLAHFKFALSIKLFSNAHKTIGVFEALLASKYRNAVTNIVNKLTFSKLLYLTKFAFVYNLRHTIACTL